MLYWVTETWGSARRFYWYTARDPVELVPGRNPLVPVPTGVGVFPGEVFYVPRKFVAVTRISCTGARSRKEGTSPPANSPSCSSRTSAPSPARSGAEVPVGRTPRFGVVSRVLGGPDLAGRHRDRGARAGVDGIERRVRRGPATSEWTRPGAGSTMPASRSRASCRSAQPSPAATGPIDADLEMLDDRGRARRARCAGIDRPARRSLRRAKPTGAAGHGSNDSHLAPPTSGSW